MRRSASGGPGHAGEIAIVHHSDRRRDIVMCHTRRRSSSGAVTSFSFGRHRRRRCYHSHPHARKNSTCPARCTSKRSCAWRTRKKTLEATGASFADLVSATRFLTDVDEQDDLNQCGPPLPRCPRAYDHHCRGEPAGNASPVQDRRSAPLRSPRALTFGRSVGRRRGCRIWSLESDGLDGLGA